MCILRELEARLEKQRATREYVQEFLKRKEEVWLQGSVVFGNSPDVISYTLDYYAIISVEGA